MGPPKPSRETNFSGANEDREIFIFPVQLATSRIGNLTRLIHTVAIFVLERIKRSQSHVARKSNSQLRYSLFS